MFTIYHSNKVDSLKIILNHLMNSEPLTNPFEAEQILVQSPGMSQWLKMAIAEQQGIAANIDFPLPATFIWNQFVQLLPQVPERSAFNKEAMVWKIMHLLPGLLDRPEFADLAGYLVDDGDDSKRYQLAEKIADIFDGYLVYRPDWIAEWEVEGENSTLEVSNSESVANQVWQPILWKALYDYTLSLGHSKYHRANLYQDFIETLASADVDTSHLPKRLFVFGITALPPKYLEALKALGDHIDVHFFFCNPCQQYWGDIKDKKTVAKMATRSRRQYSAATPLPKLKETTAERNQHFDDITGNNFLASMGKLGRDNLSLLSQLETEEFEAFIEDDKESLLHHIHSDILHLKEHQDDLKTENSEHKPCIEVDDDALLFHVCHSPMREVEVLHNQLLRMFEQDASLKPRDVIVMVADIDTYSAAIQAVFGSASGERYIPFSISDRSSTQDSPILSVFMQILKLTQARCTASELLEILEVPAVSSRFDISESEFMVVKQWVSEVGIRWGIDGKTSTRFDLPESTQNSWLYGLERLLLGYALSGSVNLIDINDHLIAPYNEVQGMAATVAGKLAKFIQSISSMLETFKTQATAMQWQARINDVVELFFEPQLEDEMALKSIRETANHLLEQTMEAQYETPLSHTIVYQYIDTKLSNSRVSQRFLAGQVNFCTLMPMRSIPFDVVCLLGMNDGVYPRSVPKEGFDLMRLDIRLGDRSRREDDRYLFLEALLSAKKQLHISYVGQSIQDNSEKVPSVLVAELRDYISQNYALVGDVSLPSDLSGEKLVGQLTKMHPLTPFSKTSFSSDSPIYLKSYAKEWLGTVQRTQTDLTDAVTDAILPPYEIGESVDLAEFHKFWRLPIEYFFTRRLKVNFSEHMVQLEDDEPFTLDGLQSYLLKEQILNSKLTQEPNENRSQTWDSLDLYRAQGKLPVGSIGDLDFQQNRVQVEALFEKLSTICQSPATTLEVNIKIELEQKQIDLQGWLTEVHESGLVRYRCGQIRSQDYLAAWIDHLCFHIMGGNKPTHIIGYKKKEGVEHKVIPAMESAAVAMQQLQLLMEHFVAGLNAPKPYFPRSAFAGVNAQWFRGKHAPDDERSIKKMAEAFLGGFNFSGEIENPYIQRVWPIWDTELAMQTLHLSEQILLPVILIVQDAEDYYAVK